MLAEGDRRATVGATYAWDRFEDGPSKEKKEELTDHVRKVYDGSFQVEEHLAGVRPATKDRRPLVGPLNSLAHTYIFGGMGSRAVLMTPYLARVLAEHFMYGAPLLEECLPQRF
jgi:glycine/D-amino acid oxidase-like deaminating enzyme